jgi:molybdate transport system substrate-binding protein
MDYARPVKFSVLPNPLSDKQMPPRFNEVRRCRRRTWFALLAGLPWLLADRAHARNPSVTLFAPASLGDVLQALVVRWANDGLDVRLSVAATSTLARQIEHGAAADVFISADETWMDYLATRGRIDVATRRVLATNRLVVVRRGTAHSGDVPEDTKALREALLGAASGGRIATGDPAHVPVGRYAEAALRELGLWNDVQARLVRADNVRSALAFVERGEATAGMVYATDAKVARGLMIAARFPTSSHPPIRYPAAMVRGATGAARLLIERLFEPATQQALREAGFGTAAER